MTDLSWNWWRTAISDHKKIGTPDLPIHENEPHIGYYRKKTGRGEIGWTPVAIIEKDGELIAVVGPWATGIRVPAVEEWSWCCRYPVLHASYTAVAVNGEEWPDSIKTIITTKEVEQTSGGDGRVVEADDNHPDDVDDPLVTLQDQIEDLVGRALAEAEKAGKPTAATWGPEWQTKADRLANYSVAISDLGKKVDSAFEVEKRPHLEAGRAVDNRWRPVKTRRDDAVRKIKALLTPYLQAQRDHEMEQRRREAEAARISAPPSLDTEAPAAAPEPVKVKAGTMGRSIGLRKRTVAKITDPKAFAAHLLGWAEAPFELTEVLQKIATKLVANGAHKMGEIPGVTAEETEVAQ